MTCAFMKSTRSQCRETRGLKDVKLRDVTVKGCGQHRRMIDTARRLARATLGRR